jgi:hypothetical protein
MVDAASASGRRPVREKKLANSVGAMQDKPGHHFVLYFGFV